jgi:hypothetical protein
MSKQWGHGFYKGRTDGYVDGASEGFDRGRKAGSPLSKRDRHGGYLFALAVVDQAERVLSDADIGAFPDECRVRAQECNRNISDLRTSLIEAITKSNDEISVEETINQFDANK